MDTNYGISMNSILRMDILHDARLLAGASGTDQIVTSVSVMVDPNIVSAVTGGELLVSTAYAIRENIPQLMQLVPQLKRSEEHTSELQSQRDISYAVFC